MTIESKAPDPYAAVLADLRAKRRQIDQTIALLEQMQGGQTVGAAVAQAAVASFAEGSVTAAGGPMPGTSPDIVETAGMFLGMSIVDAAKKLLALRKRTMKNAEIALELGKGGFKFTGSDPVNVVGSVLTRRFNQIGDVVKVGRGTWGLKEWYPGRNFKALGKNVTMVTSDDNKPLGFQDDNDPASGPGAVNMD